jgi:hypothetical protein
LELAPDGVFRVVLHRCIKTSISRAHVDVRCPIKKLDLGRKGSWCTSKVNIPKPFAFQIASAAFNSIERNELPRNENIGEIFSLLREMPIDESFRFRTKIKSANEESPQRTRVFLDFRWCNG